MECVPGSTLPDELRAQLGYDVRDLGDGERILAAAIVEHFYFDRGWQVRAAGRRINQARCADPAACLHRQSEALRVQHGLNCPPAPNGSYRAYIVGDDGHFIGFEPLVCADDSEAIEKAKRLVSKYPVDIWSGERFVQRLDVPKPSGDAVTHEIKDRRMVPKK